MEPPLLRLFLLRAILIALPFAVWLVWREIARRRGRELGTTPWAWLLAAGLVLFGLSLLATPLLQPSHQGETYVPAEVGEGGRVGDPAFSR